MGRDRDGSVPLERRRVAGEDVQPVGIQHRRCRRSERRFHQRQDARAGREAGTDRDGVRFQRRACHELPRLRGERARFRQREGERDRLG